MVLPACMTLFSALSECLLIVDYVTGVGWEHPSGCLVACMVGLVFCGSCVTCWRHVPDCCFVRWLLSTLRKHNHKHFSWSISVSYC